MLHATGRRILAGVAGGLVAMVIAPAASASIAPALTLDQSAGTTAGSTVNLGMDLKFAPSGGDSPKDLSLSLPKVKSEALKQGHLFVSLSPPVSSLVVKVRAQALHLSTGLERRAKRGQFAGLKLTVLITDSAGQRTTVTRLITKG